jgi:hypothetical protein
MKRMLRNIAVISIAFCLALWPQVSLGGSPDKADRKIYHNEKWDILLLYPADWNYIEDFGVLDFSRFKGTGKKTVGPFELGEGRAIFECEYDGSDSFTAYLLDDGGAQVECLASLGGRGTASKTVHIEERGEYTIKIECPGGTWEIFVDKKNVKQGNVPVVMHPPADEEPDAFVMVYYLGESIVKDMDELAEYFEDEYLASYETSEILSTDKGVTKEGFETLDYGYTFSDRGEDFVSNTRLVITDSDACWMILFDRPPGCPESVKNEGLRLADSIIFAAAEYLAAED